MYIMSILVIYRETQEVRYFGLVNNNPNLIKDL